MAECAPCFKQKLTDCPVVEGDAALLTVKVDGNPIPEVCWFYSEEEQSKDKKAIEEDKKYEFENLEDGTCTLTVKNATLDDIGFYTCKVSNTYGSEECSCELGVEEDPLKNM
ncbi:telokin-like [Glandiceps talaboti]